MIYYYCAMVVRLTFFLGVFLLSAFTSPPAGKSTIDLQGTVVEASTGEPLSGVTITLVDLDKQLFTDFDGKFDFQDLKPGIYHVTVAMASFQPVELVNLRIDREVSPLFISLK